MLSFKTAGESHGKGLVAIIDGFPAGVEVDIKHINDKLARRQGGYGRGGRMKIEKDQVEIFSGVRAGSSMGSPIALLIHNKDWVNWQDVMAVEAKESGGQAGEVNILADERLEKIEKRVTRPRPGHADLAAALKYNTGDIRNILERASARETAARVAVGGVTDCLLRYFAIDIISHVIQLGSISAPLGGNIAFEEIKARVSASPLHCYDKEKEQEMMAYIDKIRKAGDTLGGIVEIRTSPLPVGLGSHTQWDRKLDGKIAQAMMSIPAVKGVEIGPAFENSTRPGSEVHDEIFYAQDRGYYRKTNRAGGLEGGISNGQPLIIRIAMKPIPTLYKPLQSVDIRTKEAFQASIERSDVTALPAAGVVAEAMLSFVLAQALIEKFGGDSIEEMLANYRAYLQRLSLL
ncbi:MAG TPA: chorismate synthase [Halanaerobiaceae bacterium]|jgi:chorismate synthase|nr:chorismate synthase [Bacillota bacterium]HHU92866.1 chorismate synthase [Halanaerobiaceae bacterium]HOA41324.1 chorismate synthase [Halanaerobiales bacterium]HPZ63488.1 chorismate synthase [Halanaerobiales bacterium]HQD03971.1 chorismate synthase [Halanaerobiales bacterium]